MNSIFNRKKIKIELCREPKTLVVICLLLFSLVFGGCISNNKEKDMEGDHMSIFSGDSVLRFVENKNENNDLSEGYGFVIESKKQKQYSVVSQNKMPVMIMLNESDDYLYYSYDKVIQSGNALIAKTKVLIQYESELQFVDTYTAYDDSGAFQMDRKVSVISGDSSGEAGFSTAFRLSPDTDASLLDYDMFVPGLWYRQNKNVVPGAIASRLEDSYIYIREMRMPLPLIMMKSISSGDTISIGHINAHPRSGVNETHENLIIDSSLQYGSFGISQYSQLGLDFAYPGSEGKINYINRAEEWARRSHPLDPSVEHEYTLVIKIGTSDYDYAQSMKETWRYFYDIYNPEVLPVNIEKLYQNGIDLLDIYSDKYNGVVGLPFKATMVEGEITGTPMVMGFVGQQLPAAYQMLRYGINIDKKEIIEKAIAIVDFWALNSLTESGLPKTWYEPFYNNTGAFADWDLDIRTMSDGMEGAIDSWRISQTAGIDKPEWLKFCISYADWLVKNQNKDGSFYRMYTQDGYMAHSSKYNTTNAIRFLQKIHDVTNDKRYYDAAIKAGEFSYLNTYMEFMYVGGTSDNDNTIDKEAGIMAMYAFGALYDMTNDSKWLTALKGAADFVETWTFAWNYEINTVGTRWAAANSSMPQWIEIDLGDQYDISKIEIYFEFPDTYYQYKIQYSNDQINWRTFIDNTSKKVDAFPYTDVGDARGQYVRLIISRVMDKNGNISGAWASLWEMSIYDKSGNNISIGKKATASSTYSLFEAYGPSRAVDGAIDSNPHSPFPESGLVGQSLVATGHSYVDVFMAYCAYLYYRLYLFTDDSHYLNFAKILQNNTNRTTDTEGTFGYKYPGFVEEGAIVDNFIYNGVGAWLTWCTVAQLEPLSLLEDRFGNMNIEEIEKTLSIDERKIKNENPN